MPVRTSEAEWKGSLAQGKGRMRLGSASSHLNYDFKSRSGDGEGTNPEELIGAAHAGCFSMALAAYLARAGYTPDRIATTAKVHFDKQGEGFAIPRIELVTDAAIPGIDDSEFQTIAESAKTNCPVSRALAGAEIRLEARLLAPAQPTA